jgi:hypothetical protein
VTQAVHHAGREEVGFPFRVGPEEVMSHFVMDGVNPLLHGVVLPSALPIFGMDEVHASVLVRSSGTLSPIEVLEPLHGRRLQIIESANRRNRTPKIGFAIADEEGSKQSVDGATLAHRRHHHPHDLVLGRVPN